MNTNKIGKTYGLLSARERMPLIEAATLREDEAERERLVSTAPRVQWVLPDYHGVSVALMGVTHLHVIYLLEHLTQYWKAEAYCAEAMNDAESNIASQVCEYASYRYGVHSVAWLQFCDEMHVDPDAGCECLSAMAIKPDGMSVSEETAESIKTSCPLLFTEPGSQPLTVESVLELYRALFVQRESMWK